MHHKSKVVRLGIGHKLTMYRTYSKRQYRKKKAGKVKDICFFLQQESVDGTGN